MTYIHLPTVKMNRGYKSVLIASHVEDDPVINIVRRRKRATQLSKVFEIRIAHDFQPPP